MNARKKPAKMQMTETSAVSLFRMKFFAARRKTTGRNGGKIVLRRKKTEAGWDAFAAEHTELTRSAVQRLLLCGAVTVNGRSEKAKYAVRMGDIIEIQLPPPVPTELVPQDIPIDIVYQDADIAVINKPVGMVVHPGAGQPGRDALQRADVSP